MKTIVLLSGGIDSAVVLARCLENGEQCLALGFDYGQPHFIELDRAERIAAHFKVPFERKPLSFLVPKINEVIFAGRNLLLAAAGVALAQARQFEWIAVGCNASDWERFPDCRPEFWQNLENCIKPAYGIGIFTPLLMLRKSAVIAEARRLNVPVNLTWSCYSPQDGNPCGKCLACTTRQAALS